MKKNGFWNTLCPVLLPVIACILLATGCGNITNGDTNPPEAPGIPTVTAGDSQLTVSWAAVTEATAYEVWYGTVDDSSSASQFGGDVTASPVMISPLDNGTTYYVWIKAKNSLGDSGFSPSARGIPEFAAPGVPSVTAGDGQLTVSWAAVTGATAYEVWYGTANDLDSASQFGEDVTASPVTISPLAGGIVYHVWIKAKNIADTTVSPPASGTTILVAPTITTNQTTAKQLTVNWTAVTGATGYELYRSTAATPAPTAETAATQTITGGATITANMPTAGVTDATTYYVWLRVVTGESKSVWSAYATGTTIPAAPAATSFTATGEDRKITANWAAVTGATGYELCVNTAATPVPPIATTTAATVVISGGATTTADITVLNGSPLKDDTTYYVWVRATNSGGKTAWGSPKNAKTTAGLTITIVLDKTVTIIPTALTIYKSFGISRLAVTSSGFTSYGWFVDGDNKGSGNGITINAVDYEPGDHRVTLMAYDGNGYYSQELSFTVKQ
jgi:hypothetical protein